MTVTMKMAQAEGWLGKKGSKWQTMPELMLRKRCQSFFIKEFYSQVMFGMQSVEEIQDIVDVEVLPANTGPTDDLNATISQPRTQPPSQPTPQTHSPEVEKVADEVHQEMDEAMGFSAPRPTKSMRLPKFITKHYREMGSFGLEKKELKPFSEFMDFLGMGEKGVTEFFTQAYPDIKKYINQFHGIESGAVEADITDDPEMDEAMDDEADRVFGVPESPNEPLAVTPPPKTPEMPTSKPKGAVSLARYHGGLINHGLKPEDVGAFLDWAELDNNNIADFIQDLGAVDALIEQFNTEMGYAS